MRPAKVTVKVTKDLEEETPSAETTIITRTDRFAKFSAKSSHYLGSRWAFICAIAVILVWAISGPIFHYSDTWQLVINTGTTIVTFLMVFLIQNTQNRDSHALHLKLDELIRANTHARNALLALEGMSDEDLAKLQSEFEELRDTVAQRRSEINEAESGETVTPPRAAKG
jgi:low affinity Fe/Cu permease